MDYQKILDEAEKRLSNPISKKRKELMLECMTEMKNACEREDFIKLKKLAEGLDKLNHKYPKKDKKRKRKNERLTLQDVWRNKLDELGSLV